jgi:hypothetical protein
MRNKPQSEKLNRQPSNMGRARNSDQSTHPQNPLSKTLHNYPPTSPGNAWSRPLNFTATQLPRPPPTQPYSSNQPRDLPSNYMFAPHAEIPQLHYRQDPRLAHKLNCTCSFRSNISVNNSFQPAARETVNCKTGKSSPAQKTPASPLPPATGDESLSDSSVAPKSRRPVPNLTITKGQRTAQQYDTTHPRKEHSSNPSDHGLLQSAEFPEPTGPRSLQFQQPTHAITHQHGHQPSRLRLGNSHTEHQTREFINCVQAFNPNFSFQYLLQTISGMLLQFMQHPYESALPVIFNNFLANLLGLPNNG